VRSSLHIEIDGQPVGAEALWATASAYGHFTAMQVRGRRTRGLALHLDRLEAANGELFDAGLDRERVCAHIRHALREVEDASVRVYVFESDAQPAIMVTVREPGGASTPQRLRSVRYQRPDAHLKHLATGQAFYSRLARRSGFDDALLTGSDGAVSESAIANIGFLDGSGVVWPDAPHLHGITMQLLERSLPEAGEPSRRAPVRLPDIPSFEGAFLSNARGVAIVSAVDALNLPVPGARMQAIAEAYAAVPWDPIARVG
jgi:branched-subunit amino acid aminotransferase/4-amino-4-deoxychorismate lyase